MSTLHVILRSMFSRQNSQAAVVQLRVRVLSQDWGDSRIGKRNDRQRRFCKSQQALFTARVVNHSYPSTRRPLSYPLL